MNHRSDQQLLQEYAQHRADSAFAELVRRHLDLVYSAALRRLGDAQLAEDVAQGTFAALAHNARDLAKHPVLSGWLHRTTRNLAANLVRANLRRQTREQEAVTMNQLLSAAPDAVNWQDVAPHLDAALDELESPDRDAVLLRYFEQKSARETAAQLGISEAAAQKRVSRAVERLRELLAQRGVTVGASGLAVVISAHAVQAAPVGLALTITTAAATLTGTTLATTATVTKAIAMTILQKTIVTATIAVLAGAGLYEARQAANARAEVQMLQKQQVPLAEQIAQLNRALTDATNQLTGLLAENTRLKANPHQNELLRLRGEVARLKNATTDLGDQAAKELIARVNKLKQRLEQTPEAQIPELQLLSEQDWLTACRGYDLETEKGIRKALSGLRGLAQQQFADVIRDALQKFAQAHDGAFPTAVADLQPYFNRTIDPTSLEWWEVLPAGARLGGIGDPGPFITQKAVVDELLDRRWAVGFFGYSCTDFLNSQIDDTLRPVYQAYSAANNGMYSHDNPAGYLPYAKTAEEQAALKKLIEQAAISK